MNSIPQDSALRGPVVYARTVANALEKYLEAADTSVHWVQPDSAETSYGPPKLLWPTGDVLFAISIEPGMNEGTKVNVSYREAYRGQSQPLLCIKLLCGTERAFEQAVHVHRFLAALELEQYAEKEEAHA